MSEEAAIQEQEAQTDDSLMGSLMGNTEPAAPIAPEAEAVTSQESEPEWYVRPGVPGSGARPEYLDPNVTLEDMAKRAVGLRKSLGGFTGAPEGDYEVKLGDFGEDMPEVELEGKMLDDFKSFAKSVNMSNDTFNNIVNKFVYHQSQSLADAERTEKEYIKSELEKLEDPQGIAQELDNFAKGIFNDDDYNEFRMMLQLPSHLRIMKTLKDKMGIQAIPEASSSSNYTRDDLQHMLASAYAKNDHTEIQKVQRLYEAQAKRGILQ